MYTQIPQTSAGWEPHYGKASCCLWQLLHYTSFFQVVKTFFRMNPRKSEPPQKISSLRRHTYVLLSGRVQSFLRNLNALHAVYVADHDGNLYRFHGDGLSAAGAFQCLGHNRLHHSRQIYVTFDRHTAFLAHPNADRHIAQIGKHRSHGCAVHAQAGELIHHPGGGEHLIQRVVADDAVIADGFLILYGLGPVFLEAGCVVQIQIVENCWASYCSSCPASVRVWAVQLIFPLPSSMPVYR